MPAPKNCQHSDSTSHPCADSGAHSHTDLNQNVHADSSAHSHTSLCVHSCPDSNAHSYTDVSQNEHTLDSFEELAGIVALLRSNEGCPWDKEQTHQSIAKNMIEEAYEAVEAIESGSAASLKEELGDVLLQVLLHAQIAVEAGEFSLDEVIRGISNKLISRHPHVFGNEASFAAAGFTSEEIALIEQATDAESTLKLWDKMKTLEKTRRQGGGGSPLNIPAVGAEAELGAGVGAGVGAGLESGAGVGLAAGVAQGVATGETMQTAEARSQAQDSLLASVPKSEPALMQAQNISRKAAAQGFEWEDIEGLTNKLAEEFEEFAQAEEGTPEAEEEFGDILFTLVNIARWNNIDAESALRRSCNKFRARWMAMEHIAKDEGFKLQEMVEEEWDDLWNEVKLSTETQSTYTEE